MRANLIPADQIVEVHMTKVSSSTAVSEHSLFGPPPLLKGEDAAAYDELYGRVCAAVKPADVIDELLIRDFGVLELEILCWRRWKSSRIEERALEALQDFLRMELQYTHYRKRFVDNLTEILKGNYPKHREDYARLLARACAQNQSPAVDEVNKILDRTDQSVDDLLHHARADEAQDLTQKYRRRESATVKFIDKLLAAAGKSFDALMAKALPLNYIERIDRLITTAENRRNACLREIDRRRAVLGQKVRKTLQETEGSQLQVIEAAPALQPEEKDPT
jgi:hypothetical protein